MASFQSSNNPDGSGQPDDGTTLFLGDLSVYSTENHIRDLFQPFGKIENIRIKRGNSTKPHLCYGFIKFENKACAERALAERNGVMFLGRTLRVGWAEKKAQSTQQQTRPSTAASTQKGNTKSIETAQIHVSFISKQIDALISESTLRSLFGCYGEVVDVAIKKSQFDKKLKLQNGYGFVHYRLDEQGIQSAIQATSAIHQVTIDRVTYDCSLSHSLEVMMQQQGYHMPIHPIPHNETSNTDQLAEGEEGTGHEEEQHETTNTNDFAVTDTSTDPTTSTAAINNYQPNPATATPIDSAVAAAFPMLQAPVLDPGVTAGHYQIQNAETNYPNNKDLSATLEFFPNFQQPDGTAGYAPFPHLPGGPNPGNPFQAPPLSFPSNPNPAFLNPSFQLGMFYHHPGAGADFNSHLFGPPMSGSPMHNPSFYDDKMMAANSSFHLNKPFDGLGVGGLGGIGLGGFDGSHSGTGLSDYPQGGPSGAMPFPSLHNPFQNNFEPIMFSSLSNGINDGSDGTNSGMHFSHQPQQPPPQHHHHHSHHQKQQH